MLKKYLTIILGSLILASCAEQMHLSYQPEDVPGLFSGLWHGFIALFSLAGSVFSDTVRIYSFPNSGWGYDLGFVVGFILFISVKIFGDR